MILLLHVCEEKSGPVRFLFCCHIIGSVIHPCVGKSWKLHLCPLVILPVKTSCSKAYAIKELAPPFPNDVMELSNTLPHVEFCLAPEDANICESMQMERKKKAGGGQMQTESLELKTSWKPKVLMQQYTLIVLKP